MNEIKLPLLDKDTLALLTEPKVKSGDRLKVARSAALYISIPAAGMLMALILWGFWDSPIFHAVLTVVILVCIGMGFFLLVAYLDERSDDTLRLKEWTLNLKSARLYMENSAPNIENLVIQRGKTNTANIGNTQNNVIGSAALREFNRQYQVAQLILELLAQAPGHTPKPFSYEAVNKALTARDLSQVEVPQWQGAIQLLEGTVLKDGDKPVKWEQLQRGAPAENALDEAMRKRGLSKSSHDGKVEWHAAT